jgi:DNA polymerase/3'-5' exonuclease PolX
MIDMSSKIKHPRAKAIEVAKELTAALRDLCEPERFVFAGSLRRMKPEVGDIEMVYVPKVVMLPDPADLLGNPIPTIPFDSQLETWLRVGVLTKRVGEKGGTAWGAMNKLAVHTASGIGIDFFQANKRNFWTLLVCRTGSAESNMRICAAAEARGEKWNPYLGFEDRRTGELLFVPESEEALFAHVRLPYQQPKERI